VLEAISLLVEASVLLAVCDPKATDHRLLAAREILRHAVVGSQPPGEPTAMSFNRSLVRSALFSSSSERQAWASFERSPREVYAPWALTENAVVGPWLRRELVLGDADVYRAVFGFGRVERLRQESPIQMRVGIAGISASGVVLAGPFGLAPAAMLAMYEVALWARERWWQSHERVAESKAGIAMSETTVVREELAQSLYRSVGQELPDTAIELAVRAALAATIDLGSSPTVKRLALERAPEDREDNVV
jgi:hypothetical protein